MPEGDSLHRAARRLEVLVGEKLAVETPHPRARVTQVAERLDGRRLLKVEAVGKNLLLRFEDGLVLRSHLRMKGRWQVFERNGRNTRYGTPWLVLRGEKMEAVLWHGPVLELDEGCAAPTSGCRSARRSSTRGSSPGSGTSGERKPSGAPRSLPGRAWGRSPTSSCARRWPRPRS
jgi:hypothetical protein